MIKLAICDDEQIFLNQAERIIQEFNEANKEEFSFQVKSYVSPQNLRDDVFDGEHFDVYILDVEMRELDGLTLAAQIRSHTPNAILIFLSSHTNFPIVGESFKVNALRYVPKLFIETSLPEALTAALKEIRRQGSASYLFTHYNNITRIPYEDIVYVHRVKRMVEMVTVNFGSPQMKKSLAEVFNELDSDQFIFVDKGCFVNADHIVRVADSAIVLRNGEKITVSRKRLPEVKSMLLRLWGGVK